MHRTRQTLLALAVAAMLIPAGASACGRDTDCMVGSRSYRIALPDSYDGSTPIGAIVFNHGYRGTAKGVMRNKSLIALANEEGLALIASQADGPEWNIPNIPSHDRREGVDELAYFDAVIADATGRFAIDPDRIVASGFSSGAMMVWHLACYRGEAFAGFIPMSGTFWAPIPDACPSGPINLIHYHGDADPVVPLHGRRIANAHQGDVYEAISMLSRTGGYQPVESPPEPGLDCDRRVNAGGKFLELCIFQGKHGFRKTNLARAWRLLDQAPRR